MTRYLYHLVPGLWCVLQCASIEGWYNRWVDLGRMHYMGVVRWCAGAVASTNLPYILVHKTHQMSHDTIKILMIHAKVVMLAWTKNKCIHPIYQSENRSCSSCQFPSILRHSYYPSPIIAPITNAILSAHPRLPQGSPHVPCPSIKGMFLHSYCFN